MDDMLTALPMLSLYDSVAMNVPGREQTLQGLVQVGAYLLAESLGPILFLTPPLDSPYLRRPKLSNLPKFYVFH